MKSIITFLILTIASYNLFAQADSTTQINDTIVEKTIAVVPFMPQMYNNDLARLWYKTGESLCQEKQFKDINKALIQLLNDTLGQEYGILDLNESQTISTTDYLLEFYLLSSFSFKDTFPQKDTKLKFLKKKKKTQIERIDRGQLKFEKEDRTHQYLNADIRNMKSYRKYCKELGVDEVLFINQFDVKGDFSAYNSGRETNYYINIHYSLYDKEGHLLLGNKTKFTTTNERARYGYFLDHDVRLAGAEITKKIKARNKAILEAKLKADKKKKQ